ncbi:hypothetical protein [Shewanella sp. NIFS-20-20]|uniref:hypothetical protein n=1 Tax=Shewanella sp. NIFS-20-20 TaxID=2853806 RepID=UPI001C440E1B|nr:hypothetical protein [Shewanella sp. NIFS-20-20]MBV7315635.1 hypothetical protein [Shewanella sp. NIFS-20-20]
MFRVYLASTIAISVLVLLNLTAREPQASACENLSTHIDTSLPTSHPLNRCAIAAQQVSWSQWFSGNSRSMQFHFIDLLELIAQSTPKSDDEKFQPSPQS